MFALKKAYYRVFQAVFNIGARLLPWRKATVVQEAGAILHIPSLLFSLGAKKPMVVTDPGLMKAGVATKVIAVLENAKVPYALFDEVERNPSVNTVNLILEKYLSNRCDSVVAIGGGSSMDAAKAAAARV
ncbi:iron-containing alcohol dehydrogenase, partial [Christensenellaceae bacterium OttesenSCG-928-L17]|nr:iron-containing alcohol dehydrogenase [Christensenellaceae bacterium OttesenSCG-928-L17]